MPREQRIENPSPWSHSASLAFSSTRGRLGRPREDAELVSAHAIGGGLGADRVGRTATETLEQRVARGVPERVVVGLEAVEVVEAEGERPPAGLAQRALDVAVELAAVAEPRERVVRRLVLVQPRLLVVALLGELALGDVLEHGDRVVALAVRVPLGGRGDAHPDHLAVLAEAALLELVGVQRAVHDLVELAEVLLDVVGVRVLLEFHRRELGGAVAEHRLERRIHLDDLARAIDADDADRRSLEDRPVARGASASARRLAARRRRSRAGARARRRARACTFRRSVISMTVDTTPTTEPSAATTGQRMVRKYCVFAGSPGSRLTSSCDRRNARLEHRQRCGDDLRRELRHGLGDRLPDELGRRLIAEDPEGRVYADDAEVPVDDRHADARLREERVELRFELPSAERRRNPAAGSQFGYRRRPAEA